ncbi:MAG: sigma-70 family RNA polymerase sigma factor [Bacteroidales bacterium]|nr:sigma-70 family RNA polymerase sigma factor [Bacteroidales bacterium]
MSDSKSLKILTDHYLELYDYAFSCLNSRVDAEDVLHDALAETLSRRWLHDPYAYCKKVVRNKSLKLLRDKETLTSLNEIRAEESEEESTLSAELHEVMKEVLSQREQKLVEMHDMDSLTMREISEITGLNISNVKKLINQAHIKIRKKLL